ncbi:MAG: hypothetical protein HKN46_09960 [Acidimicrobiia bacterium]|nr:hypothetical protein [Acidimicrobiia bacterium]
MADSKSFFEGDNIWILVPLAALSIPIFAIFSNAVWIPWLIFSLFMVAAVTLAVRSVVGYQHRLRMEELEMKERLMRSEHEQLRSAERILELDETQGLRDQMEPPAEA